MPECAALRLLLCVFLMGPREGTLARFTSGSSDASGYGFRKGELSAVAAAAVRGDDDYDDDDDSYAGIYIV